MRKHRYFVILVILLCSIADLKGVSQPSFRYLPRCHPISDVKALPTLCGPGTNLGLLILGLFYILAVTLEPQCAEATVGSKRKNPSSAKQKSPATKRSWKGFKEGEPEPPMLPEEIMEHAGKTPRGCHAKWIRKPLRNPPAEGELWQCTSASLPQTKDTRGVVEMLLMIAGDVEPNPGPITKTQLESYDSDRLFKWLNEELQENSQPTLDPSVQTLMNEHEITGYSILKLSRDDKLEAILDIKVGKATAISMILQEIEEDRPAKRPKVHSDKIWVKVVRPGENRVPIGVRVDSDADIDDVVCKTLEDISIKDVDRSRVTVDAGGRAIKLCEKVVTLLQQGIGTNENALLLKLPEVEEVPKSKRSVKQPTLGSKSPSEFAKHPVTYNKIIHVAPLFSHWFAINLYNHFMTEGQGQFTTTSDENLLSVEQCFKTIASIPGQPKSVGRGVMCDGALKSAELTLTALYARALDRFLFPDELVHVGACLHQLPVKQVGSSVERADLQVAILHNRCPHDPVLLSDVKLENLQGAIKETGSYAIRVANVTNEDRSYTVHLGLPVSDTTAKLLLLVGDYGFLREITICEARIDSDDSKAFFATLFGAVHYLISNPIHKMDAGMEPMQVDDLQVLDGHNGRNNHVFKSNGTVYKLYDTEFTRSQSPNIEVIESISTDYLPDLLLTPLTVDNRVMRLQYSFIPGNHTPHSIDQFVCIVKDLEKLHAKNYVHSDIRDVNLVFSKSSSKAWMIDFDLAGAVGTQYPPSYKHDDIPERHQDARAYSKRQKEHDMFALSVIIKQFCPFIEEETVDQLQKCNYSEAVTLLLDHKCSVHRTIN